MKKHMLFLTLAVVLILAACQPVPPAGSGDQGDTSNGADVPVPGTETAPATADEPALTDTPRGVSFSDSQQDSEKPEDLSDAPRPDVLWNTDPGELIVSGTYCCGFVPPIVRINYIPEVQIWGDGRIVWVENKDDGSRQVWEAQLSQSEMESILQDAVDAGFFGMKDRYANNLITDLADQCLTINLRGFSKTVCEYYEGAPQAFHALFDELSSGAGAQGTPYTPEIGLLTAHPIESDNVDEVDQVWQAEETGVSLTDAREEGIWVEGNTLESAWETVNADPWGSFVREGDEVYQLSLQIPELHQIDPPQ